MQEKCRQVYFCADKQNQESLRKQPAVNSVFQMSLSKSVVEIYPNIPSVYCNATRYLMGINIYIYFNEFKQVLSLQNKLKINPWEPLILCFFFLHFLLFMQNTDKLCIYKCNMSSWE